MCDIFEEFTWKARYELEEIIAATDDFVVSAFCIVGPSARSGRPLSLRWTGVTWFRDGKLTRAVGYTTRREALEATGLRPRNRTRPSLARDLAGV